MSKIFKNDYKLQNFSPSFVCHIYMRPGKGTLSLGHDSFPYHVLGGGKARLDVTPVESSMPVP